MQGVWGQADEVHQTNSTQVGQRRSPIATPNPGGAEVVPNHDTQWDNTPGGTLARDQVTACLLVGLCKAAFKSANCEKLQAIVEDRQENPSQFLECPTEALL